MMQKRGGCYISNLGILGERIRHYRKQRGLTQKELDTKLRFADKYIASIEQGLRGSSLYKLVEDLTEYNDCSAESNCQL
jgi:transcriptional regulator with XRE-family HTH domain